MLELPTKTMPPLAGGAPASCAAKACMAATHLSSAAACASAGAGSQSMPTTSESSSRRVYDAFSMTRKVLDPQSSRIAASLRFPLTAQHAAPHFVGEFAAEESILAQ